MIKTDPFGSGLTQLLVKAIAAGVGTLLFFIQPLMFLIAKRASVLTPRISAKYTSVLLFPKSFERAASTSLSISKKFSSKSLIFLCLSLYVVAAKDAHTLC